MRQQDNISMLGQVSAKQNNLNDHCRKMQSICQTELHKDLDEIKTDIKAIYGQLSEIHTFRGQANEFMDAQKDFMKDFRKYIRSWPQPQEIH